MSKENLKSYGMAFVFVVIFFITYVDLRPEDAPLWQHIFIIFIALFGISVFSAGYYFRLMGEKKGDKNDEDNTI